MISPAEILIKIYFLLKVKPYSVEELHKKLSSLDIQISKRSTYRYLEKLEVSLHYENEVLEIETEESNKKVYLISQPKKEINFTVGEWINFLNNNYIFQSNFNFTETDKKVNTKIIEIIQSKAPLKSQILSLLHSNSSFYESTKFGEIILNNHLKKLLYKFIYYFSNNCFVTVKKYSKSVISQSNIPIINSPLLPLRIWYHRGNYSFSFYSIEESKVYTLEIDMIESLSYHKDHADLLPIKENLRKSIDDNFGYHSPIIDGLNEVILQFPPNPGEHIMNRFWHKNQRFERLKDGTIQMHFATEINIELIGWIGMWLDNVKIVSPELLKKMFSDKLNNMTLINSDRISPINNG
jgi:predicted DNA-binding transcriptional regulator YafY